VKVKDKDYTTTDRQNLVVAEWCYNSGCALIRFKYMSVITMMMIMVPVVIVICIMIIVIVLTLILITTTIVITFSNTIVAH